MTTPLRRRAILLALLVAMLLTACGGGTPAATDAGSDATTTAGAAVVSGTDPEPAGETLPSGDLVVYSGRNEELVGPLLAQFEAASGIKVAVKYGDTAELAATLLEEGDNSPADLFFAQDAGALGLLTVQGRFMPLPEDVLASVPVGYRAPAGEWVGVSGRVRVVAYNTEALAEADLPASILDFTDPQWQGRIGWAPTNGSFQAFVTALRQSAGEEGARAWLEGIQANAPKVYANNTAVLEAVASGEVEVGFINHYYLFRKLAEEGEGFAARNHFFTNGDIGGLVNVAGVGILRTAQHAAAAEALVRFLLSEEGQTYFRQQTKEYPLVGDLAADATLPPLTDLNPPAVELNSLSDLEGTLELLQAVGIL